MTYETNLLHLCLTDTPFSDRKDTAVPTWISAHNQGRNPWPDMESKDQNSQHLAQILKEMSLFSQILVILESVADNEDLNSKKAVATP